MYYYKLEAPDFECENGQWLVRADEASKEMFEEHIIEATVEVVADRLAKGQYIHRFSSLEADDVAEALEKWGYRELVPTATVQVMGHGSLFTGDDGEEWPEDEMLDRIRARLQLEGYTWEDDSMLNFAAKHRRSG